jgi:hypothetical protein
MAPANSQEPRSLAQLLGYFLRLGTFGFGGPIALAGRMDRDLVEERGWVSRQDYVEGLAFSQLSPGPTRRPTRHVHRLGAGWTLGRSARCGCIHRTLVF